MSVTTIQMSGAPLTPRTTMLPPRSVNSASGGVVTALPARAAAATPARMYSSPSLPVSVGSVRTAAMPVPMTMGPATPRQTFISTPASVSVPSAPAVASSVILPAPAPGVTPAPPQAMLDSTGGWSQPSMQVERQPPPSLTQGLPDPRQIESQRGQYMKSLDDQLKQGAEVLTQQLKQQQEYLVRMGDQQKRQFGLQVDQNIKHQELELVQQHNHQLLMLQQAAQQQKVALEQQANALLIEYNQKKATEDLASQMYSFETAAADAHRKYQEEISTLQQQQIIGAQQLAVQGEALARQANMSNLQAIAAQQVASRTSASLTSPIPQPIYSPPPVTSMSTPPASYLPPVMPGPITAMPTMTSGLPRSASRPTFLPTSTVPM